MNKIVKPTIFIFIVFVCSLTCIAQEQSRCEPPSVFDYGDDHTLNVEASDLLKQPKCYDGKFVRAIGFYYRGFEVSRLFCLDCNAGAVAWVEMDNFYAAIKQCTSPANLKKLQSKDEVTYGVVVLGVLKTRRAYNEKPKDIGSKRLGESIGGYGHMGAYDTEFSPICLSR